MAEQIKNKAVFEQAVRAFSNRDFAESIGLFTEMIVADPDDALAWVSRAAAHLRLGNLETAVSDCNRAIGLHPKRARPYHMRGLIHDKRGDLELALEDFNQAIALDPEYGAAYYSRSSLFAKMGDNARAQEDAQAFAVLTEMNVAEYANENNIWRSHHLTLEDGGITDPIHR